MAAKAYGGMSVDVKGEAELMLALARLVSRSPAIAGACLHAEAEVEVEVMQDRTPRLSGDLAASGQAHAPAITDDGIEVVITFGEGLEPYAVAQHERLDYQHDDGEARFLTSVLEQSASSLLERVARRFMGDVATEAA